jgi:hypothetical protein
MHWLKIMILKKNRDIYYVLWQRYSSMSDNTMIIDDMPCGFHCGVAAVSLPLRAWPSRSRAAVAATARR